jgi:hypothetical protein
MPDKETSTDSFVKSMGGDWSHTASIPPSRLPSQQAPREVLDRAKNPAKIRASILKSLSSMNTSIKESHARMAAIKENEELMNALEMQRKLAEHRDSLTMQMDEINDKDPKYQRNSFINTLKEINQDDKNAEEETIEAMTAYLQSKGFRQPGFSREKPKTPDLKAKSGVINAE